MEERYNFAYLQRTENDVKIKALPELEQNVAEKKEVLTSRQWLKRKFGLLRAKTRKEGMEGQQILTDRENALPQ